MAAGGLDVLVRFVGDTTSIRDEVGKVEGTGPKLKSWAKGIGAAIGAAFAIDQLKTFVSEASALQDAVGAAGVVFGPAAKQVEKFSSTAAEAFGMSNRQALEAATNFAGFGKQAGLSGADLAAFGTDLTGLAGDLSSFKGVKPEEALAALGSALAGETEPMRKFNVMLDENTLKARAMAMGLISSTKDALTPQQKVLATQAELFAQTGDAQGDFERTSDSAANQQKTLTANIEDTQASIGTALLPVMQELLPYLQKMATFVEQNAGWLVPLAGAIIAIVAAVKLWSIAQLILNASLWASPITWIILAVVALIAVIVLIVTHFDVVKAAAAAVWSAMQTAWDAILGVIQGVWNWIKDNWPTLLAILTGPIGVAVLLITKNWDTIKGAIEAVWNWIKSTWEKLTAILTAPFDLAASIIRAAVDGVRNTVQGAWDFISGIVTSIVDGITGIPGRLGDIAGRIGNILKGPINTIIRGWNAIEFKVPEIEFLNQKIGGQTIRLPHIGELEKGGLVARTGLAVVHEGERYSGVKAGAGGWGGTVINLNVEVAAGADPAQVGRTLVNYLRAYERANGRTVLAK